MNVDNNCQAVVLLGYVQYVVSIIASALLMSVDAAIMNGLSEKLYILTISHCTILW